MPAGPTKRTDVRCAANGPHAPQTPGVSVGEADPVRRLTVRSADLQDHGDLVGLVDVLAVHMQLVTHGYVPQHSATDKLGILGRDVADLIETIDHNLQHGASDPRFQRKVMYAAIPAAALPAFRKLSSVQAQALLEKLDRWLAEHDAAQEEGAAPNIEPGLARVGLGIYYFEERLEPSVDEGATP